MNFDDLYASYGTLFDTIFQSGVAPFIQETGFQAQRIITGVSPDTSIDPDWISKNWGRGGTGNLLYTADLAPAAFAEVLHHTGDGYIPQGTYRLTFECSGSALNHQIIAQQFPDYGRLEGVTHFCERESST
jgi:hypothetical protein